jgi:hypothetical protein
MEISNARLIELVRKLLTSVDDNCYEFSEKMNVIKGSGITAGELKALGFDYMNDWIEDTSEDEWEEPDWDDDDYVPSSTNGDYSPSTPYNAPGMCIADFIEGVR